MKRLALVGLLVGSFALSACIVRTGPRRGRGHHAVKGKHTHKHCHRKHKKKRKVCHRHPHRRGHH